jgi:L-threonylcarbamoyladenylate synthase
MGFGEDLKSALIILKQGGIVLHPTDTIWGLGCDATNNKAVESIFQIKNRRESKSLIVLVNSFQMLERYVSSVPEAAANILDVADKPITIIYPKGKNLASGVCAEDGSVGIRICEEDFCNELITRFRKPIVSTSANFSDKPAPSTYSEIEEGIVKSAGYVVKYRQDEMKKNTPSSVIKIYDNGVFTIIRQ